MSHTQLWNIKDLQAPPITTYKSSLIDIMPLRKYFQSALEYFENLNVLEQEAALLSRCIYRMKTKLRTDKGLKSMEKLNRALLQFNYLNLRSILSDFISLLPDDETSELYLPSRNMLDYVLVRLQGVTCLMHRAVESAHIAASYMGSRICIGHLWKVALIVLGVISRIWFICRDVMKYCCDFYKNIKSVRNLLKSTGSNWLPDQYNLPECLATWLNIDWVTLTGAAASLRIEPKIPFFDLVDSSDVEECGNYIEIKDNVDEIIHLSDSEKSKDSENISRPDMFERLMRNNDFGEVISSSKQLNNTVINLSSESEDDSVVVVTENKKGVESNFNDDKPERTSRIYGWQEHHNKSENFNLNSKVKQLTKKELCKRTGCINIRDNVSDIDISDNDNLEAVTTRNEEESTNAVRNLTGYSEDDELNRVYTNTEQLNIENTNNKKKRKEKLSKKENKHGTNNVEQVTFSKEEETTAENENNVTKTALKQSIKRHKSNKRFIQIIDNLNSIKKLKTFMSNLEDFNLLRGPHKVDKLQLVMLRKVIKKYTNRAKKELISNSECLLKAKKVLKVTFIT